MMRPLVIESAPSLGGKNPKVERYSQQTLKAIV